MKLTTTKISIPVLMMMLFQSGYGAPSWFGNAFSMMSEGKKAEDVIKYVIREKGTDFVKSHVTNPELVPAEIQAILNGTDEAQNVAPEGVDDWIAHITQKVIDFSPRGLIDNTGFQNSVVDALLALEGNDISVDGVRGILAGRVVMNFAATLAAEDTGWLSPKKDVYDEVSLITGTWAKTDVPDLIGNEMNEIPPALLGEGEEPASGTIKKFISGIDDYDEDDASWTDAWNTLIGNETYGLSDLTVGGDTATLELIKAVKDVEGANAAKERAVYDILVARADEVRLGVIPEKDAAKVPWGSGEGDAWRTNAKQWIDEAWTNVAADAEDKAKSLRECLYGSSAKTLAEGRDPDLDPETDITQFGYKSSDELSYYLSLFGYWNIDGNKDLQNPNTEESFLQSILGNIEAKVVAEGGPDIPGSEGRNAWVDDDDNVGKVQNIVKNAVYSAFGTKYEDLLRHSSTPSSDDLSALVNAVISAEVNDGSIAPEEIAEAVHVSLENFDDAAANQIVGWLTSIKNAQDENNVNANPEDEDDDVASNEEGDAGEGAGGEGGEGGAGEGAGGEGGEGGAGGDAGGEG